MKTKIISFFADIGNNYYSSKAANLIKKCQEFGVPYDIQELKSKGSYMLNCLQKPQFIKDMMNKHNCPLIWMDCDTDFKQPFSHFDNVQEDIGFATHSGDMTGMKASPIYFNNTDKFELIINSWIDDCNLGLKINKYELDHDALKHVTIPRIKDKISIFLLSNNYNDFCNGKYIVNGNAPPHTRSDKSAVHKQMREINERR